MRNEILHFIIVIEIVMEVGRWAHIASRRRFAVTPVRRMRAHMSDRRAPNEEKVEEMIVAFVLLVRSSERECLAHTARQSYRHFHGFILLIFS